MTPTHTRSLTKCHKKNSHKISFVSLQFHCESLITLFHSTLSYYPPYTYIHPYAYGYKRRWNVMNESDLICFYFLTAAVAVARQWKSFHSSRWLIANFFLWKALKIPFLSVNYFLNIYFFYLLGNDDDEKWDFARSLLETWQGIYICQIKCDMLTTVENLSKLSIWI